MKPGDKPPAQGARATIEVLARGVCIVDRHLLLCRGLRAGNLYLPGGHVEFGEGASAALAREIHEELGVKAVVGRFLGCVEHCFVQQGRRHAEINLLFALRLRSLRPGAAPASRESWIAFEWLPLTGLARSRLEPAPLRRLLPRWLREGAGFGSSASFKRRSR